jgi:site-specific DNA recombinase
VYRGETFRSDHQPILDPALFSAVQEKLSAQAVERRCRIRGSPAVLAGRLFDAQGHRMTPTHTNKKGVRYRYYVSLALLRKRATGSVGRVPAPELETAVLDAIRRHLQGDGTDPKPIGETERELIDRYVLGVTLSAKQITIEVRQDGAASNSDAERHDLSVDDTETVSVMIAIPWTPATTTTSKGIAYVPAHNTPMRLGGRERLLVAIAKARRWMKEIERGHSFAEIARREQKAERHIRHLAPLAFVAPRIVTAIMEGNAPAALTIMALASSIPYSWAEEQQRLSRS